jgi:hypothetical protein
MCCERENQDDSNGIKSIYKTRYLELLVSAAQEPQLGETNTSSKHQGHMIVMI